MNKAITNSVHLMALKNVMHAFCVSQETFLEKEITRISSSHAAVGRFKSGATIHAVLDSCLALYKTRANEFIKRLKTTPLKYDVNLSTQITSLFNQLFSIDFGNFKTMIKDIVHRTGNSDDSPADKRTFQLLTDELNEIQSNLSANIEQHILILKTTTGSSSNEKIFFAIEGCSLLATVYLAGMWTVDKNGNYEPWIVLFSAVIAIVEIARRRLNK